MYKILRYCLGFNKAFISAELPQLSDLSEYLLINSEIMKSPLKPRITYFYSVIFQEIATTLVLPCKIVGNPKPEFQWLDYDNNTIIEDSRIKVSIRAFLIDNR